MIILRETERSLCKLLQNKQVLIGIGSCLMLLLVQLLPPFCVLVTRQSRKVVLSIMYQVTKGILYRVLQWMQALEYDFGGVGGYLFFIFTHVLLMQFVPLPLYLFWVRVHINFLFYLSLLLWLHLCLLLLSINDCVEHHGELS